MMGQSEAEEQICGGFGANCNRLIPDADVHSRYLGMNRGMTLGNSYSMRCASEWQSIVQHLY